MKPKPAKNRSFVAYYRVSTDRQGRSGLGLEAQQAAVRQYVSGHGQLAAEYTEVVTGKRSDRPNLANALAHARRQGATLVIAKLDRLARNMAFTATLMESGADFVACDIPEANRLTIHILAAVAEDEARRISERTKAALDACKARGGLLGANHPKCRDISRAAAKKGSPVGAARVAEQARKSYADILPVMPQLRQTRPAPHWQRASPSAPKSSCPPNRRGGVCCLGERLRCVSSQPSQRRRYYEFL